jgi:hypothetical protein
MDREDEDNSDERGEKAMSGQKEGPRQKERKKERTARN